MPMFAVRTFAIQFVLAVAAITSYAASARAQDYFAGKTMELLVGAPPGGGYDIYARAVGRHLGRHIPGNPTIIVKNMPGAGSAKAAQYITSMAPKDGTSFAGLMPGAIMGPLLDEKSEGLFDPTKVQYLGTANNGARVCVTMKGSKLSTFDDAQKIPTKFGGSGPNDSTYEYGYLLKRMAGAAWDIVAGYRGTTDASLAMERGELDGLCGWDWSSFKAQKPDWLRDNKVNVLLQVSLEEHPELTKLGVPSVFKYVKSEADRKAVELVISQTVFQRSYILPPETPKEQLGVLRAAFDALMKDKQFLDEADKLRIEIAPLSGLKVQELVQKLYATPKDVVDRAKKSIR
jgi:tripartite-type tricarboxylate transporter receptor subunit TctC